MKPSLSCGCDIRSHILTAKAYIHIYMSYVCMYVSLPPKNFSRYTANLINIH